MEKAIEWEQKNLISELIQGKELALELRYHLQPCTSSHEKKVFLIEKILSSYEKSLSMLNWEVFGGKNGSNTLESPHSFVNSTTPRSEASDQDQNKNKDSFFKKRKVLPRWSEQVKVCSGTGLEGPLDDGYCWRKYGQKDIQCAKFPRGYYRCTHRHGQGCLATKQVQRSDDDPTIVNIIYRGRHTCTQGSQPSPKPLPKQEAPKEIKIREGDENSKQFGEEMWFKFGSGLKVKTEDLDTRDDYIKFPSFCLSDLTMENMFTSNLSTTYLSPAESESNYFSFTGLNHNVQTSESDFTDIISAPTSVTNSPIGDIDFSSLDKVDIDKDFPFDNPEFFS